jgi:hypothetical protein
VRVPRLIFPFVLVWGCREAAGLLWLEVWKKGTRRRSGGSVEIPPLLRDFQGAVEERGILLPDFLSFHRPVISTVLREYFRWPGFSFHLAGGNGDSILHCRSSLAFASPIFRAHSVSLIFVAVRSSLAKLPSCLRYCAASGSDFSFS